MAARKSRDDLWAITTYFNPIDYRRRRENYVEFRKWLDLPLVCVEMAREGTFDLSLRDAEIMIRVRDGSLLWQKERLLNIAWSHVPADCRKIVWIDCDVFYDELDWAERISRSLDEFSLVQAFARVRDLGEHDHLGDGRVKFDGIYGQPVVKLTAEGHANYAGQLCPRGLHRLSHSGLCWAARREVFEGIGLYDVCVLGTGDRTNFCGPADRIPEAVSRLRMNPVWERHFRAWSGRVRDRIRNGVGYVDLTINHLWHGSMTLRRYLDRYEPFRAFDFDPDADLELGGDDCWKWASDKPDMHEHVRNYFLSRREDG